MAETLLALLPCEGMRYIHGMNAVVGYGSWFCLSIAVMVAGQRLDQADLRVPLAYHGDALLILPLVKCTVETGTHWRNDKLGAPGIQDLHDFPIVDHLHFVILWVVGQFSDYIWAFNLYHLTGYPLAVLTTMLVLRSFGVSFAAAGLAGMLYTFLPFHQIRGLGHYFLSVYWTLPLSLWPVLRLLNGDGLFDRRATAIGTILIAVMTACSGAYYAFFTCACLAFAGVCTRRWQQFGAACSVITLIVLGGVLNHLPTAIYQAKYGPNTEVTQRQPEEAEEYGLKLAQMLMPVANHHWKYLGDWRARYDSDHRVLQNENETSTLGLIGSVMFVALMIQILFSRDPEAWRRGAQTSEAIASNLPLPRSPPQNLRVTAKRLPVMVLFLFLLGTVGGIGSLFNFFITPSVRSLNRVSIVQAFFVFTALAVGFDRLPLRYKLKSLVAVVIALAGVWDETPRGWFRTRHDDERHQRWQDDRAFFQAVESDIGMGSVLCVPMIPFPETLKVGGLAGYDHARGYLHTNLHWSFGGMKGREADQWQRELACLTPPDVVQRAEKAGFRGVFIDFRGLSKAEAEGWRSELRSRLSRWHADGQQAFFQVSPDSAPSWQHVRALWLRGFVSFEPLGREDRHRWCGRCGVMVLMNPYDHDCAVEVSCIARSSNNTTGQLRIDGVEVWSETMALTNASAPIARTLFVPPGRHTITFTYAPPREHVPKDARDNVFFIAQWQMKEIAVSR